MKRARYSCHHEGCVVVCSGKGNLEAHKRVHTGERPFVCNFEGCQSRFKQGAHLKRHENIHNGHKPYSCQYDGCDKSFADPSALRSHELMHTGERPYKCAVCQKAFTGSGTLTRHMRTHSGEKPYICQYQNCLAAFANKGNLDVHERLHTGQRPFKCEQCPADFVQANHLKYHMLIHREEKEFVCPFPLCSMQCRQKCDVTAHYKRMHSAEGVQRQKKAEEDVARTLTDAGIPFSREHQVSFTCVGGTNARADFVIDEGGSVLFIEVSSQGQRFVFLSTCKTRAAKCRTGR